MAEESQDQEKTEEATQTRREEFRKKGMVPQSKELATTLFLLASFGGVFLLGQYFVKEVSSLFNEIFGFYNSQSWKDGDIMVVAKFAAEKMLLLFAPVAILALILGIASSVLQTGFMQVEDALLPKFEKIDPLAGLKRMFSLRNLAEAIKSVLKFLLIGFIVYLIFKAEVVQIPRLIHGDASQLLSYMGSISAQLFGSIGAAMGVLTVADYFFQRWENEKQMMMTKEEVKKEAKEREGDPLIKARIRKIQREMANRRMMDKVPKADVIITNPTHIAVALKYDESLPAPQLVAKGADLVAEKIKQLAKENGVPIVENKPLARTIFKTLKIGQVIPRELFIAVAEVLSFVYRLKKKRVKTHE
jgi:flagellar biosynthetic protein FlhB